MQPLFFFLLLVSFYSLFLFFLYLFFSRRIFGLIFPSAFGRFLSEKTAIFVRDRYNYSFKIFLNLWLAQFPKQIFHNREKSSELDQIRNMSAVSSKMTWIVQAIARKWVGNYSFCEVEIPELLHKNHDQQKYNSINDNPGGEGGGLRIWKGWGCSSEILN